MLKKLNFLASIAVLAAFTGCSSLHKSNTLQAVELTPKAQAAPMVADLEVSDKKTLGQAKGKVIFKRSLEQEAIAEALKQSNADVLVGASYFYEEVDKTELTVTVVGYPARYKNFRPKEINSSQADVLVGGNFFYKDGNNNLSVAVKSAKPGTSQENAAQEPVAAQEKTEIPAPVYQPKPQENPETLAPASPEENIQ